MASVTTSQAVSSFVNFLIGGTVNSADAANNVSSALDQNQKDPLVKYSAAVSAGASVAGIASSSTQMLLQFKEDSPAAGALMGKLASNAAKVGLAASIASVANTAYKKGIGEVQISQLASVVGAALSVRAFAASPRAAIGLGVLSAVLTVASWETPSSTKLSDVFEFLKSPIHSYYDQLSPSEQSSFTDAFSTTLEQCFSGCLPVPQVDNAGWVYDWEMMMPTAASPSPKGGVRVTFANGVEYIYGAPVDDTPLQLTSAVETQDVWNLAQSSTRKSGLNVYANGSFSNVFKDDQIGDATEVWISGTGHNYTVAADSKATGAAPTHFIYIDGSGKTVTVECDNNFIFVASGNSLIVRGQTSRVYAQKSTTVIFETSDPEVLAGSTLVNEESGEIWTVGDDGIAYSSAADSSIFVINPGRNFFSIDNTGKSSIATQSEDGRMYHNRYDASGLMEEQLVILPTGGYTQLLFNYPNGYIRQTQMLTSNDTGTGGSLWKFNKQGQTIEYISYLSSGTAFDFVIDPGTGNSTLVGTSSFPPFPRVSFDATNGSVTWYPR
ncbi:hypothetical protein [Paraburkholderia ginsengisoli]|uniref:Uncharacterized protein n=1 Tax=Paraburkholderia ginsengisoli TaxID=311231 RepID=A0A7T4N460_9BURK|nr:hypothetical protein [Paraburkholderia ginsengisoli]QQC64886.1 hypothetical protein I6I06_05265 [Paraburkholderia ginsengisoli]